MSGPSETFDPDIEAAEYVFGTLSLEEREAFIARAKSDAATERSLVEWEARCAGLGGHVPSLAPPAHVWERIERLLGGPARTIPFAVIDGGGRRADDTGLKRSRDRWRIAAVLSGALAAALVITLLTPRPAERGTYVAAVNRGGDKPALIVRVDMASGQVLVRPVAAETPPGKSLELWVIGADKTPRSMGVLPNDTEKLVLPTSTRSGAETFAVTVEPPGGSKTGGPTGPVVYSGQLVKE